ncbi:aldehyde dehydrogenase (NADP(+)), partial [Vibrio parahaemolyticus]|nr:aldehyde dehydrogenase (NADP(+)) [Vibrio parahaemolyticus]
SFVESLTLGAGQFCTNPGLIFAVDSPALDRFVASATSALSQKTTQVMLTPGIHAAFQRGVEDLTGNAAVQVVGRGAQAD